MFSHYNKEFNPLSVIWFRALLLWKVHNFKNISFYMFKFYFSCCTASSVRVLPPTLKQCKVLKDFDSFDTPAFDTWLSFTLKSYSPSRYPPRVKYPNPSSFIPFLLIYNTVSLPKAGASAIILHPWGPISLLSKLKKAYSNSTLPDSETQDSSTYARYPLSVCNC